MENIGVNLRKSYFKCKTWNPTEEGLMASGIGPYTAHYLPKIMYNNIIHAGNAFASSYFKFTLNKFKSQDHSFLYLF